MLFASSALILLGLLGACASDGDGLPSADSKVAHDVAADLLEADAPVCTLETMECRVDEKENKACCYPDETDSPVPCCPDVIPATEIRLCSPDGKRCLTFCDYCAPPSWSWKPPPPDTGSTALDAAAGGD